ncbi:YtzH-like family protein [Halalkalibacter nanhaiisediminis]|uniref:YtzH-like protein n=1 Tax=Halalkalibacter nanhaiisediminis TaxID=688079 RepID=A0A562QJG5_9BACI|nr:YtzH-like family protein [Halalkalibacter nanhaiisediminis]TWI56918.1 YtzH-like protein [Halalkalibacter nanhaiisediminis]
MPLTSQDKLRLLKDLLQNQAAEQYMTNGEATQIERLVSSLAADTNLDPAVHQTLDQIQQIHQINHEPFQQADVDQWLGTFSTE